MAVSTEDQERLRTRLRELGFDDVRFAGVDASRSDRCDTLRTLPGWICAGMHADMHWMERSLEKRLDPARVLPGVRSIIVLGVSYWSAKPPIGERTPARWARYALYDDYHDTIKPALVAAGRTLEGMFGVADADYRYYVDTGPVIDRGWAARAGVGFVGKNAMLISRDHGNWLFIAAILTRIDFAPDEPVRSPRAERRGEGAPPIAKPPSLPPMGLLCGKCVRCLEACPTRAFVEPGVVDARRCISYQTIENKGVVPRELREGIGTRIYGCDICLEVCPWNRFACEGRRMLLASRNEITELSLPELLAMTPERFAAAFRRTPIKRVKLGGLLRNACIVAGNSGDRTLLPVLTALAAGHALPLVRAHAVWAVFRLGGGTALAAARETEQDAVVLAEYAAESAAEQDGSRDRRAAGQPRSGIA